MRERKENRLLILDSAILQIYYISVFSLLSIFFYLCPLFPFMSFLDIVFAVFLVYGLIRGLKNGLFVELASLVSFFIGIYIAVKFSVRVRDLGSTIAEAQEKINAQIKLPNGYSVSWNGEFENQTRATKRLNEVVPLCLLGIFLILFVAFGNVKDAVLTLLNVPFALIGGILALHIRGMNFSISAGIGMIALFGICIQNGVILISVFKKNLEAKMKLDDAIFKGVLSRVRPIIMTALMAAIGLLPAAISTGIGSESQKPLATVVIGGLMTSTVLTLLILPILYKLVYKYIHNKDHVKQLQKLN